jgi:hypothetical protein
MKILYLITTFGNGIGGHYFDLITTIESLSNEIEPVVVNIGRTNSPIISNLLCEKHQWIYKLNYLKIRKDLEKLINKRNIEVIHCFDDRSYFFLRSKRFSNIPCIITKCGGPNQKFFPKVKELILFSTENLIFFKGKSKFKNSVLHFIPNRVAKFNSSLHKINLLKHEIDWKEDDIIFLKIGRIDSYYKKSIIQSIKLVNELKRDFKNVKLIIIGKSSDIKLYDELISHKNENIFIQSNEDFTENSKEVLEICDFYIGTGRGIMEASSKKKILLTPVLDRCYPALVTHNNFLSFFGTNFSERNITDKSNEELINEIKKVVTSINIRDEFNLFSNELFNEHFNIDKKTEYYIILYRNAKHPANLNLFDRLIQNIFFHYHYITQG